MFRFVRNKKGQGMTEYALILGLLVAAIVAAFTIFGPQVETIITKVTDKVKAAI